MSSMSALLRELEATMVRGTLAERSQILSRVTDLFIAASSSLGDEQISVFDVVIGRLSRAIELRARVELSKRLAPVPNAPIGLVRQLALDEIVVARPMLTTSQRLSDQDLLAISAAKGRDHMLAICERTELGESVTDFLILRGGRVVTHAVAANAGARFSRHGMGVLVMRAVQDDALQSVLGNRTDIPGQLAEQLMAAAKQSARRRLEASLEPGLTVAVAGAVERGAAEVGATADIEQDVSKVSAAFAEIARLRDAGRLDEATLATIAGEGRTEHAVCALAMLADLTLPAAEQVVLGTDREAVLLVGRGLDWSWETVRALIGLREDRGLSDAALARAQQQFQGFQRATAQRVLSFLRTRDAAGL